MSKYTFLKSNWTIPFLIILVFFIKGVFLVALFPIFEGQDESRHYNTIQFLNEPKEKNWEITTLTKEQTKTQDKENLSTYRFSEEIKNTSLATENYMLRSKKYKMVNFSNSFEGKNESEINSKQWPAINKIHPADITGGKKDDLYHKLGLVIENKLEDKNILIRFYAIRTLSILLATLTLLFFYLTLIKIDFSKKASFLLTAIISFHPNLSFYTTNINYAPLLFLSFSLFTYGGILWLKDGINWKNSTLLIFSVLIGIKTKGTAIVLVVMLLFMLAFEVYKKINLKFKNPKTVTTLVFCISTIVIFTFFGKYLPLSEFNSIGSLFKSLWEYIDETISIGKFGQSSKSYWGLIGWTDSLLIEYTRQFIWFIQAFSVVGLVMYFFNKEKLPKFLPEKKYSVFLLGMIAALQLGVRLAGWKYFDKTGDLGLGAPGRYFLPNIMAHIVLVYVGIGMLLSHFKKEKYFALSLKIGLVSMFCLCMYLIFNVMIYRYYLL